MAVEQLRQGCFALVFVSSLAVLFSPAEAVPTAPPGTDVVVHAVTFAALAYTALLAGLPLAAALVALPVYALGSELVQALPALGRSSSLLDLACDLVGAVAGLALAREFRGRDRWWSPPDPPVTSE